MQNLGIALSVGKIEGQLSLPFFVAARLQNTHGMAVVVDLNQSSSAALSKLR